VLVQHTVPRKYTPVLDLFVAYFRLLQSRLVVYSNRNSILFNNVYHIRSRGLALAPLRLAKASTKPIGSKVNAEGDYNVHRVQ
jgi:hypothetical protein